MAEKQCNLIKNGGSMTTVRFPNFSRLITSLDANYSSDGINYTATEDCWVNYTLFTNSTYMSILYVDGVAVASIANANYVGGMIPIKKGSVITSRTGRTDVSATVNIYAML